MTSPKKRVTHKRSTHVRGKNVTLVAEKGIITLINEGHWIRSIVGFPGAAFTKEEKVELNNLHQELIGLMDRFSKFFQTPKKS